MSEPWVRVATPADAPSIVAAIREGFTPEVVALTVYGCSGVEDYVAQVAALGPLSSTIFLVAGTGSGVLGAAEFSRSGHTLVLSYISVREEARYQGLGGILLSGGVDEARATDASMSLDVFEDNTRAFDWYRSLGFVALGRRSWWSAKLPEWDGSHNSDVIVSGFPQAEASHRAFGFSEFSVRTGAQSWSVGRLGDTYFRLTDPAGLASSDLLAALGQMNPARRILCLGDADAPGAPKPERASLLMSAHRLTAPMTHLRSALSPAGSYGSVGI
jgi:GNAT superfamily N-acetyltransferase